MATTRNSPLRLDRFLPVGDALKGDLLDRGPFARQVVRALEAVSAEAGLVVSVEGAWGCGKSTVLSMVEELLQREDEVRRPVVVHFNPWLIGDRDALLRQFLSSIAKQVKLTDHAKEGKRVGRELKTYAKAFDLLKLVPGAEPWASMVKSALESAGDATSAVADYKAPDIESHKRDLERALKRFSRRIVVLIDDIDRLFAAEVFEMVRIVKAVGDLPNVGYVLAWDERYVSSALDKLNVPLAPTYLDKVVQVRMRVPPLSLPQRISLMDLGMRRLDQKAQKPYFSRSDERHAELFHSGLADLLEQPRDVVRLFDVVTSIEPGLRGEIQLSDVIALATLMTKAPAVYELLHSQPQVFVGRRPGARSPASATQDVQREHKLEREQAIDACANPGAVREVVHWLFPEIAAHDKSFTLGRVAFSEGHLSHPDRLLVALQLSARPSDVSLQHARDYLFFPDRRDAIEHGLTSENCAGFVAAVGHLASDLGTTSLGDAESLVIALGRLADKEPFATRAKNRSNVLMSSGRRTTMEAIMSVIDALKPSDAQTLLAQLVEEPGALVIATTVATLSFFEEAESSLKAPSDSKTRLLRSWADNIQSAIDGGTLFDRPDVGWILWQATMLVPERCSAFFAALRRNESSLDQFAEQVFRYSFDSHKGQVYGLPPEPERIERYAPLQDLKDIGRSRLALEELHSSVKTAWRSVVENKKLYAKDGSEVDD